MTTLEKLIKSFSRLPGIGKKSAGRIAYFLLKSDPALCRQLADQLTNLHRLIIKCSVCGNFTEQDPCQICSNPSRDPSSICVVEEAQDIQTIEETREFNGLYHVLGGSISPMDGVGADDLSVAQLMRRVTENPVREVILATNPTVEGDTTALYLQRMLKERGIAVSRLASGLPVGGDLEYADRMTLARSFKGRTVM
ncbi:MAG: recombination mediator RecR [Spirochaetaceae bacterium]|nr:recombination mediator RecR [Spirochaetaceae bacterium]MCF7947718.1 recombination mediator RecR [Spirochaetia bacterium]MCF7951851.1 recombination mediator RecR [Spirochaetaceae bacterium]